MAATGLAWLLGAPLALKVGLTLWSVLWLVAIGWVVVHESAHALTGIAVGLRVHGISIGREGPLLATARIRSFHLTIHLFPVGGFTRFAPAQRWFRPRHIVATAAGPICDIALLIAAWRWEPTGWVMDMVRYTAIPFGVLMVFANLLHQPRDGERNDAAILRQIFAMTGPEIDATKSIDDRNRDVLEVQRFATVGSGSVDDLEEIRLRFLDRYHHPGLSDRERGMWANNVGAVDMLLDRPDLLAEADEMSAYAYENLPNASILATRGSVLIALGRVAEARRLLERSLAQIPPESHGIVCTDLALACALGGDLYSARKHLAAVDGKPNLAAYRRAADLIGRSEIRNVIVNYWAPDRTAVEAGTLLRTDGADLAGAIAKNLRHGIAGSTADELASVFLEATGSQIDATDAMAWIEAVATELISRPL